MAATTRAGGVPTALFVVGDAGVALVFVFAASTSNGGNSGTWYRSATGTNSSLNGVVALDATRVVAVGSGGTVLLWTNPAAAAIIALLNTNTAAVTPAALASLATGGTWRRLVPPARASLGGLDVTAVTLYGATLSAAATVLAVGTGGTIVYVAVNVDGTAAWSTMSSGTTSTLYAVSGSTAVGAGGVIVTHTWSGWAAAAYTSVEWAHSGVGATPLYAVSSIAACLVFGREAARAGRGGASAIEARADIWHSFGIALYCGGRGRVHMTGFNVLELYMRRTNGYAAYPTLHVTTWNAGSRTVPLAKYIVGSTASQQGARGAGAHARTHARTHARARVGLCALPYCLAV